MRLFRIVAQSAGVMLGITLLNGCVGYSQVRQAEINALSRQPASVPQYMKVSNFDDVLGYGLNLSDAYIALADQVQTTQDVLSIGVIAAAVSGAAFLAYGADADAAIGAALAGGSLLAVDRYLRPQEAAEGLLDAAEAMHCIVRAGQATQAEGEWQDAVSDRRRIAIVANGYGTVRTNLRQKMQRSTPSYGALARDLVASTIAARTAAERAAGEESIGPDYETLLAVLRAEVSTCMLPSG